MRTPATTHRRLAGFALAGLASLLLAAGASARTETIRWQHADASTVAGFRIHLGNAPTALTQTIDVGLPSAASGVYSQAITVPDGDTLFVTVTAYGPTGLESTDSNLGYLPAALGAPGQPSLVAN